MSVTNYRRYSKSEEEVVELDERCCFDRLSVFTCLPLVAGLNFFMDIGAACFSLGSNLIYCFGIFAIFSLLCFGSVTSGVQEEQSAKIKLSIGWIALKLFLISVILVDLTISIFDVKWFAQLSRLTTSTSICVLLLVFLPFCCGLLVVQLSWSKQMLAIIAIRDMLYIIPSEVEPVAMRNSLRLYLESQKAQRYSISTVLSPEKY